MEDVTFAAFPFDGDDSKALFMIFDGHAGKDCAIMCNELFPQEVILAIAKTPDLSSGLNFEEIFVNIDKKMMDMKVFNKKQKTEMYRFDSEGCTATVAFIWRYNGHRYLQVANVGDSYAFLSRNNKAIPLTKDHKVATPEELNRLKHSGMAIKDDAKRIPQLGLAIARTLGDHFAKEVFPNGVIAVPYVHPVIKLNPNTDNLLLLASDGLWDIIDGQTAINYIKNETDVDEMAEFLVQSAIESPQCGDNVSAIVVRL